MSKHQVRLLLCSAASVALMVGALFVVEWFSIDFGPSRISIDLRSAHVCMPDEGCRAVSLSKMTGFYPFIAAAAFWCSLPLVLIVLVQTFGKILTGTASAPVGKLGVSLGGIVFFSAFLAGYLFGPETDGMFEMMSISVSRTFAAPMLLAGSMLAMLAMRTAQQSVSDDEAGEYKPIVVRKDVADPRLPVTPIHVKPVTTTGRIPTPPGQSQRIATPVGQSQRIPTPVGQRDRISTPAGSEPMREGVAAPGGNEPGNQRERIVTPSGTERLVRIPPSSPGARERIPTPGPMQRIDARERIATPGPTQRIDSRERIPTPSGPVERVMIPPGPMQRVDTPGARERIPTPGPMERPDAPGPRERIPTPGAIERIPMQGRERVPDSLPFDANVPDMPLDNPTGSEHAKPPSQPPAVARTMSPSQASDDRPKTPSQPPDGDRTKAPSEPPAVARTMSPSGRPRAPSEPPPGSGTSLRQPASERTKSPSQPGDRQRSPSQQPVVSRTTSPQQPLVARTASPQHPLGAPAQAADDFQSETPSERDLLRARMAAVPMAVAIKPPLPEPVPVPPDQIPVAPESGLVIRKRTPSSAPLASSQQLPPVASQGLSQPLPVTAATASLSPASPQALPLGSSPAHAMPIGSSPAQPVLLDPVPIAADTGLTIRKKTISTAPVSTIEPASQSGRVQKIEPVAPSGRIPTASMPSVALRDFGNDLDQLELAPSSSASPLAIPAVDDDAIADLALRPGGQTARTDDAGAGQTTPTDDKAVLPVEPPTPRAATITGQPVHELKAPAPAAARPAPQPPATLDDSAVPPPLRGKLRYAVVSATLASAGIQAQREDGTHMLVEWESIVGIIARRLPNEAPYDGATFVDLVSTAGSTVRILPWTKIAGAPVYGEGEERARVFVQLVAAHCLDAKLDSWTKVFADGAGHAAQLPNAKLLGEHDNRLA